MTLHLKISGKVQAVFFRQNTQKKAQSLGLLGYVKNMDDGTVEILAQGERDKLEQLLAHLKTNPGNSQIEKIEEKWDNEDEPLREFEIRY